MTPGWALLLAMAAGPGNTALGVPSAVTVAKDSRSAKTALADTNLALAITIEPGTERLLLVGDLLDGAAARVATALAKAPDLRQIALDSPGGLLIEAEKIAQLIRDRGLDTVVIGDCLSACTHVLLAGVHRTAMRRARIGFHRPYTRSRGSDDADASDDTPFATIIARGFYERAKVPEAFIDHVFATPSASMWYPARAELIANNILTPEAPR